MTCNPCAKCRQDLSNCWAAGTNDSPCTQLSKAQSSVFTESDARRCGFDETGFAQINRFQHFTGDEIVPCCGQFTERRGIGKEDAGVREPVDCLRPGNPFAGSGVG